MEPTFSAQSGFYDADFTLTLQAAANVTIYYTLDGSDPATSETAVAYTDGISIYDRSSEPNVYSNYQYDDTAQSITIYDNAYQAPSYLVDKATIVRAVARDSSGNMSRVITNTYFRLPTDKMTSYEGLPVVSLVTDPDNLFDPDTGIYVTGNQYLEWKNSSSYDSSIDEWSTQNKTNFYSKGKAWERPVSVSIFENGVLAHTQEMGIRVKGASTRNSSHKSFNCMQEVTMAIPSWIIRFWKIMFLKQLEKRLRSMIRLRCEQWAIQAVCEIVLHRKRSKVEHWIHRKCDRVLSFWMASIGVCTIL